MDKYNVNGFGWLVSALLLLTQAVGCGESTGPVDEDGSVIDMRCIRCKKEVRPNEPLRRTLGEIEGKLMWIELQVRPINEVPKQ